MKPIRSIKPIKTLRENIAHPTNPIMKVVYEKPYTSLAALTTFGIGMALLLPNNMHRLTGSAGKTSVPPSGTRRSSSVKGDYFEAAPRSIYGSHRSYQEFADQGSAGMVKKGGGMILGAAATLATLYYLGKKK